jgi:hypothetical protein
MKKIPKKHIFVRLLATAKEEDIIRDYYANSDLSLGRLAVISLLEHISRDKR